MQDERSKMATIEKRGGSYRITVSCGQDINGRNIRKRMTWTPKQGMTERQIEKELNKQAVLFEDQVKCGVISMDDKIRFSAFSEKFMEYARLNLKTHTVSRYERQLVRINQGIGHIKLKDLRPAHIASFITNLQESGIKAGELAVCKIDISVWCRNKQLTLTQLQKISGVSRGAVKKLSSKENMSKENALKLAAAMREPPERVFEFSRDMTPLKASSVHSYFRTLSSVLSKAVKWGYITSNPATGTDLPSNAGYEAKYLDEDEARRLLQLLTNEPIRWRCVITFDLLSGLRRGELLGLRWSDVDLDNQLLNIRQTWNYDPSVGCYTDTPKSRKSERPLKISRTAKLLLVEYKSWQQRQQELLGDAWLNIDDRVFTTEDGAPMFPDSVTQWFHKFVKRNDLPDVHVHSLRHTYASLQIAEGTPLVVVSRNLGHAQTSTTGNIYAHVIASAEAKAAEVMDCFADVIEIANDPKFAPKDAIGE